MAAAFFCLNVKVPIMRTKTISATNNEVMQSQLKKILNSEVKSASNILGAKIQVKHLLVYLNLVLSLFMVMAVADYSLLLTGAATAYMAICIALLKKYPIKGLID